MVTQATEDLIRRMTSACTNAASSRSLASLIILLSLGWNLNEVWSLDNGAADTPPLGWCSWQRYRCAISCNDSTSTDCFNERLIRDTADAMVSSGLAKAGYEYVALDDCWQAPQRIDGHVVSDPHRFPSGIKALVAYVHSKGLKFGLYTAVGNYTCASGTWAIDPIGLGCDYDKIPECSVAKRDINDYVSWDIDHIKVDGCRGFDQPHMNASYAIIGSYLQEAVKKRGTGPVVYHPSNLGFEYPRQFRELASIGNQWRFQTDVQDSWESVAAIIQAIGAGQPDCIPGPLPVNCTGRLRGAESVWCGSHCVERDEFLRVPGKGGWHDPDMLLVGETPCSPAATKAGMQCSVLSLEEQQTQMAIWAMASAPLLLSADLTNIPNLSMAILTNPLALNINQDAQGRMPFRFISNGGPSGGVDVWRKDLAGGDVAVAIVHMAARQSSLPGNAVNWTRSNEIYDDDTCPNIGTVHCDSVDCCKVGCLADPKCTAINVNEHEKRCIKRACNAENISRPETSPPGPGWASFWITTFPRPLSPRPPPLLPGFAVKMSDIGYAFNTQVRITDVFEQTDLGIHQGTFVTHRPIPAHGAMWLHMKYSPQYPSASLSNEL